MTTNNPQIQALLDRLPRTYRGGANAIVWINAAGDLYINIEGEDDLFLPEEDLGLLRDEAVGGN